MKRTIWGRIFFGYAAIIALLSLLIIIFSSNTVKEKIMDSEKTNLRGYAAI